MAIHTRWVDLPEAKYVARLFVEQTAAVHDFQLNRTLTRKSACNLPLRGIGCSQIRGADSCVDRGDLVTTKSLMAKLPNEARPGTFRAPMIC